MNGTVRQRDSTRNLVFKPAETISELSTFANIAPGDVLLTGTPSGCALRVPPPAGSPHRPAASRGPVLEAVPQVAKPPAAIPAAGDRSVRASSARTAVSISASSRPKSWRKRDAEKEAAPSPELLALPCRAFAPLWERNPHWQDRVDDLCEGQGRPRTGPPISSVDVRSPTGNSDLANLRADLCGNKDVDQANAMRSSWRARECALRRLAC